jgi:hypothetical protein
LRHSTLDINSTAHGINDAAERDEKAVTSRLGDSAVIFLDLGIGQDRPIPAELPSGVAACLLHRHP